MGRQGGERLNDELRDFLRTGVWSSVRVGMTRAEVVTALGQPDAASVPTRRGGQRNLPAVLKYGSIEFHFDACADTLSLIFVDDFVGWDDVAALGIEEAEGMLERLGTAYRRCEGCRLHMGRSLITDAGVVMQFGDGDEHEEPSPLLAAIYQCLRSPDCQDPA